MSYQKNQISNATNLVLGLNRAALAKGEKMVAGDYAPESRIRQHLKDVRHMREYAPFMLPLTEAHEKLLAEAVAAGDGERDNAAIIRRWKT